LYPSERDWEAILSGVLPRGVNERRGELITDFYTYNTSYLSDGQRLFERHGSLYPGSHWVGDLAVECLVDVQNAQGAVLLELVEGGVHYQCRIDTTTGAATLSIDGGRTSFVDATGKEIKHPQAKTSVVGTGQYRLRLANCDDEMVLWVNGSPVTFDGPTTYANRPDCAPKWSAEDPGDLAPAGVGSEGAALTISSLQIWRDIYYIAGVGTSDYQENNRNRAHLAELEEFFQSPEDWETAGVFEARDELLFKTEADQFFPLGDNSPQSQDARSWHQGNHQGNWVHPDDGHLYGPHIAPKYVRRDLLIGKALLIYWPHAWNSPVPFTPNFSRMGIIH
jgi:signal peptidase I